VNPRPDHLPLTPYASIRTDARLDRATRQKVDDLARRFHTPRTLILAYIMEWGLRRKPLENVDQGASQGPVRHLYYYVAPDLHERVQKATKAAGIKTAPWLRHMVRRIAITDFPASWHEALPHVRSHDSRHYRKRFMIRLDDPTREKLEELSKHLNTSAAEIIRHLVSKATPKDFPQAWQSALH
jgi:predicted transcriptional regulator